MKEIIIIIISSLITTLMIFPLILDEDWNLIKSIKRRARYVVRQILYLWTIITFVVLLSAIISVILFRLF